MNHDDYYNYDPYWDDTDIDTDCPTCWKAEDKCICDTEPDDFDCL
jgi:hypothetical protein